MKYQIKYIYDTGDSFHTEYDKEDVLEEEFNNLEIAEQNLERIKEHYKYYRAKNSYRYFEDKTENEKIIKSAQNKDWFVKAYDFCLVLKLNNGKDWSLSAPWCGYFETLKSVEIIPAKTTLKRIDF